MKKYFAVALVLAIGLAFVACKKDTGPAGVFDRMKGFSGENIEDAADFYTAGTMEALRELQKLLPEDQKKQSDNKFAGDAKWEVVEEKVDGDNATVRLRFTEHPVASVKGTEVSFRLKKEGGQWKMDMEQEMRMALEAMKGMGKMTEMLRKMQSGR